MCFKGPNTNFISYFLCRILKILHQVVISYTHAFTLKLSNLNINLNQLVKTSTKTKLFGEVQQNDTKLKLPNDLKKFSRKVIKFYKCE